MVASKKGRDALFFFVQAVTLLPASLLELYPCILVPGLLLFFFDGWISNWWQRVSGCSSLL